MARPSSTPTPHGRSPRLVSSIAIASCLAVIVALWMLRGSHEAPQDDATSVDAARSASDPLAPSDVETPLLAHAESLASVDRVVAAAESDVTLVRVRVVDDEGRPLSGVRGFVDRVDGDAKPGGATALEFPPTDADGRTELRLYRGAFDVRFNPATKMRGDSIGYGSADESTQTDPRWLATHESARLSKLDVFGALQERTIVLLRFPCELEVIVRDGAGSPAAGIEVGAGFHPSVVTDVGGRARIDCLPEGRLEVELAEQNFGPGKPYSAKLRRRSLSLRAGTPTRAEFDVVRNGVVEVAITECTLASGELALSCDDEDPSDGFGGNFETKGNAGSIVRFDGVPPSRYSITTTLGSDDGCWAPRIHGVHVVEGTTTRIALPLAPANRSFSGRVIDTTGTPRSGVLVTVFDPIGGAVRKSTITGETGAFRIDGLPDVPLRGGCDTTKAAGEPLAFFGTFEHPWFDLPATGDPVELRAELGCTIRGSVFVSGEPKDTSLYVAIDRYRAKYDDYVAAIPVEVKATESRFEFEFTNLRPGSYRIRVGKSFATSRAPVTEVFVSPDSPRTRTVTIDLGYIAAKR